MTEQSIYQDISQRTGGAFLLGVVGPVRTGKSTFIKRFMETMVIPRIDNTYMRERAKDELPQSGSGRTIMTAEPKFVPENAVSIRLNEQYEVSVRLIDCVGYMVDGAAGQFEDGSERMVTTPWYDHEISITDAAEKGTRKVIAEHSTIGIVVTTDGSICEIPRENYVQAEARVIHELQEIGKPFVVLLNSTEPNSDEAKSLAAEIAETYGVSCLPVNCQTLGEGDICAILEQILMEFPLKSAGVFLPEWLEALDNETPLKAEILTLLRENSEELFKIKDTQKLLSALSAHEHISEAELAASELGSGAVNIRLRLPRSLYYQTISEQTGWEIQNDGDLIATLADMSVIKTDYDRLRQALEDVRSKGYGVVVPDASQMRMEEPQIVKQGGKYAVKLKASAPAIHMLMTNVETEVTPAIGGESASEDIINFLLEGFNGDVNRIWQSNIFGKPLNDLAEEGLAAKIQSLPEEAKGKLQEALQRILNEGSGGLICILL